MNAYTKPIADMRDFWLWIGLGCIALRVFLRLSYDIHTRVWNGRT